MLSIWILPEVSFKVLFGCTLFEALVVYHLINFVCIPPSRVLLEVGIIIARLHCLRVYHILNLADSFVGKRAFRVSQERNQAGSIRSLTYEVAHVYAVLRSLAC